jgi:hypothetical protein
MVAVPAAIIFVNMDLVDQVRQHIVTQLHISEAIDGYTFDQRLIDDPQYICRIKGLNQRILVERPYTELQNRSEADVVIFVKNGLASILQNNFGPPRQTFPVVNLYWGQLGIFKTPP